MAASVKTTCPFCGVGCGVIAEPQPDGSVAVKGDPDHPANFGRLCAKGSALGETLGLEGRLLYPEINGERTSWDRALDVTAGMFARTVAEHGPDSVAFYVSGQILTEDYYAANKVMKGFIGSANIDTNSRLCMASSVAGHRRAFGSDTVPGTYEDLELADVVVLVGSNLIWCHPVLYQRIAAAKQAKPAMKVVLVDPRRTKTADLADMHLDINPDSDAALFNGLFHLLGESGNVDAGFVADHTIGFEAAAEEAAKWTIEAVAEATGLAAQVIEDFYRLWAGNEKVITAYSQGVNQSVVGTDKVNSIINCHLATARIGRPGMGPFSLTGQPNAMGGREVGGLANMLAAHMDIENPDHRASVQRFWQSPVIANRPGLKAVDMFRAVADGRIKALWIMATNPVVSMPDADNVEEAIRNCPFVVVSDVMAETDTVRHAQVKLPSLAWGEKDGTVTNSERRISRQRGFLAAPGEAKADWWQVAEIAKRMGFAEAFNWPDASAIFAEHAALSAFENDGQRDFDLTACAGIAKADYDALLPFQWPQSGSAIRRTNHRFYAEGAFHTPDGRARLIPVTPPANTRIDDGLLRLNTGRVRDHWHTMTRTAKSPRLSGHMAEPYCEINPIDAARRGIDDADLVTLLAGRSSVTVRALITDDQKPGNVFVPMHWNNQTASNARVDSLVAGNTDPFSGQPASKGSNVQMEKAFFTAFGFCVSRVRPNTDGLDYWAAAATTNGWRLEFALIDGAGHPDQLLEKIVGGNAAGMLTADDAHRGFSRAASFTSSDLDAAVWISPAPVGVSRGWASDLLTGEFSTIKERWRVLAGRPTANQIDKGALICSCMEVGANEIAAAVRTGCHTVEAVGKATCAGTNCGSCKAEITEIIHAHHLIAAE